MSGFYFPTVDLTQVNTEGLSRKALTTLSDHKNQMVNVQLRVKDKIIARPYIVKVSKPNHLKLTPMFFYKTETLSHSKTHKVNNACYKCIKSLSDKVITLAFKRAISKEVSVRQQITTANHQLRSFGKQLSKADEQSDSPFQRRKKLYQKVEKHSKEIKSDWHKSVLRQSVNKTHDDLEPQEVDDLLKIPKEYKQASPKAMAAIMELISDIPYVENTSEQEESSVVNVCSPLPTPSVNSTKVELSSSQKRSWTKQITKLSKITFDPDKDITLTPEGSYIEREEFETLLLQTQKTLKEKLSQLQAEEPNTLRDYQLKKSSLIQAIKELSSTLNGRHLQDPSELALKQAELQDARKKFEERKIKNEQIEDMTNALEQISGTLEALK